MIEVLSMPKIPWVPPENQSIYDPRYKPKPSREDRKWNIEKWEDDFVNIREPRPMTSTEIEYRNRMMEREYERMKNMKLDSSINMLHQFMPLSIPDSLRKMLNLEPPKPEEKGPPFDITVELFYDARWDRKVLRLKATVIGKDFEVQHQFGDYMNIDPGEIAYHRRRMEETMQEELLAYWVENHS
jgi:hypothetical protein